LLFRGSGAFSKDFAQALSANFGFAISVRGGLGLLSTEWRPSRVAAAFLD
jgi:hypothetical protein